MKTIWLSHGSFSTRQRLCELKQNHRAISFLTTQTGRRALEYLESVLWCTLSKNTFFSHKSQGRSLANVNVHNVPGLSNVRVKMYLGWETYQVKLLCSTRYLTTKIGIKHRNEPQNDNKARTRYMGKKTKHNMKTKSEVIGKKIYFEVCHKRQGRRIYSIYLYGAIHSTIQLVSNMLFSPAYIHIPGIPFLASTVVLHRRTKPTPYICEHILFTQKPPKTCVKLGQKI